MADYEIDLISDNAAKPSAAMRRYMCGARVGDEERREDPTVRALEDLVAELTGKDDACLMPSGTMSNVVSFFVYCSPSDEILIHTESHPVYSKYAGPDVPGRATLHRVPGERGRISPQAVQDAARRRSNLRLVSIENTHNRSGGSVWPLDILAETCRAAHERGLPVHLDGARLPNACVAGTLISRRSAGMSIQSGSTCQKASAARAAPCWPEVPSSHVRHGMRNTYLEG